MLGWNRRAIRITLPATAKAAQVKAAETLCAIGAKKWQARSDGGEVTPTAFTVGNTNSHLAPRHDAGLNVALVQYGQPVTGMRGGCSFRSRCASWSARTTYAVVSTGLSSIQRFSPTKLPSAFCNVASLSISSSRQSCALPLASVMTGSSYASRAWAKV